MALRTLGVEEEFLLYRRDEPRLADVGPDVAEQAAQRAEQRAEQRGAAEGGQFEKELKKAQAEHASPATDSLGELAAGLASGRSRLMEAAGDQGTRLVASGTNPVSTFTETTEDDRYLDMADRFADIAGSEVSCATHVHVAISDEDEGVAVLDRIAPWLHVLLALTANSPFHDGRDTGYASYRRLLWGLWPTSGPTTAFGSPAAYHATVDDLVATGAARDTGMIYFDARLSANYPTVEIRVGDVVLDAEDAVVIAGLLRALVGTLATDAAAPTARVELLHAAAWRAARYGMTEQLVDLTGAAGRERLTPADTLVAALVGYVEPELSRAGDLERVREGLAAIRRRGTGASRQRTAARHGLPAVLDAMTLRSAGSK